MRLPVYKQKALISKGFYLYPLRDSNSQAEALGLESSVYTNSTKGASHYLIMFTFYTNFENLSTSVKKNFHLPQVIISFAACSAVSAG